MPLKVINVEVTGTDLSMLILDVLSETGALSVGVTDLYAGKPEEQSIYEQQPPDTWHQASVWKPWEHSRITALYPQSVDAEKLVMNIATNFNLPSTPTMRIQVDSFDEKTPDHWVRQVQEYFQPVHVGHVRISFPWHPRRTDLIDVRIEPGLAFGTGEHPTTQLCATWLTRIVSAGNRVLDFGCGSGVLAIIATLLAADVTAVGVDIDPEAIDVARRNAELNDVTKRTSFFENADQPQDDMYDIVVANILAKPLKQLAPHLVSRIKPGGYIALSGILISQAPQLVEYYSQYGITLHDAEVSSEWAMIVGNKGT